MKTLASVILRFRKPLLALLLLASAFFAWCLKDISINPDITSYLSRSDPAVTLFDRIGEEYSGNALGMVVLQSENVISHDDLSIVRDLTERFKLVDGVAAVISLTNVVDIRSINDELEITRLVDPTNIPDDPDSLAALKAYILSKERYRGRLLSEDGTATLIICRIRSSADEVTAMRRMKAIAQEIAPGARCSFGGQPYLMVELSDIIVQDLKYLIPLVPILIVLALLLSFRSWRGVVLPMLSVGISTLWTMGTMAALGIPLTIISNIIPVILIAVGSAYSIHIVNRFNESAAEADPGIDSAVHALGQIGLPVLLAALTTMAGFISFIFGSYLTMIREFGLFTALGVFFSFIVSMTLVPAILVSLRPLHPRSPVSTVSAPHRGLDRLQAWFASFVVRRPRLIVGMGLLIIAVGIAGIPLIERKVDIYDYFKEGTEIRRTDEVMKRNFGGSVPLEIVVRGDVMEPGVLREMKRIQNVLDSLPDTHNAQSIADFIEEMSDVMGEGRTIPDSRERVANLWFLLEGEEIMNQYVNYDRTEGLILATMTSARTARELKERTAFIDSLLATIGPPVSSAGQTGMTAIYHHLDTSILQSQYLSLMIALSLILLSLVLLLRSLPGGLIGLTPILVTLIIVFGTMGYASIPLDVATVLLGSISIGIGVDYAIHFISRYRLEHAVIRDKKEALARTITTAGKAIVINFVTVMLGFLVLTLANLVPLQRFGLLGAITMLTTGIGAIVLLPAIMLLLPHDFVDSRPHRNTAGTGTRM